TTACPAGTAGFVGLTPLGVPGIPVGLLADRLLNDTTVPDLAAALSVLGAAGQVALGIGRPGSGNDVVYELGTPIPVNGSVNPSDPTSIGDGDVNRDGRLDLVV